jgi:hypothetical protein
MMFSSGIHYFLRAEKGMFFVSMQGAVDHDAPPFSSLKILQTGVLGKFPTQKRRQSGALTALRGEFWFGWREGAGVGD